MLAVGRKAVLVVAGDPAAAEWKPLPRLHADAPPETVSPRPVTMRPVEPLPRLNPEARTSRAWLLAEGPAHAPDDNERLVTFTFDDGPSPETTPHLLDLLEGNHVRATFFFIGRYLDGEDARAAAARDIAARVARAGHLIGNHTHDHKHLTEASRPMALAQIDLGAEAIERATGEKPLFFRPPYGDLSRFLERTLAARGTELVLWSIEACDMLRDDPDAIAEDSKRRIDYAGGGIVLLHDVKESSVHAFAKVLHWLNENRYDPEKPSVRGYRVVDLDEYIRRTAASPQPFATRQALEEARKDAWIKAHGGQRAPEPAAASDTKAERTAVRPH